MASLNVWLFLLVFNMNSIHCFHYKTRGYDNLYNLKDRKFFRFDNSFIDIKLIWPGTKWCGAGDKANSPEDLGKQRELDKCCRAHDQCPQYITAGNSKYGLKNTVLHTRLSCECDNQFWRCLHEVQKFNNNAWIVGNLYFNALHTKCFTQEHPIIKCVKSHGLFSTTCTGYEYNYKAGKTYQWFDVRPYNN